MDSAEVWGEEDGVTAEVANLTAAELRMRTSLVDSELKYFKSEANKLKFELNNMQERIKEAIEKIRLNKQLPYLVGSVVEVRGGYWHVTELHSARKYGSMSISNECDLALLFDNEEEGEEDGAATDIDLQRKGKCIVIKTSTRQTVFLPVIGLVEADQLKPGDLVGVNKDSYLVLDKLPAEYDARVKAMEVDERPTEEYSDVGGLDKQIQELIEAIVLPMTHKERFDKIGIRPPKGPQLVQMFIGDGAKMVRDAFELAKEKAPAIIFIDELDAIGTKRFDSELSGDREVQRTMLELLNQLDGFSSDDRIKVIAATNRPDVLDPALLRSGRLDRKIELPHPNEDARERILQIHARKMTVNKADVNFRELARSTDDFNGAQLKAVCVEAGMIALRRNASELQHEDFVQGIAAVQAKKKSSLNYFT
ncbi:26S protease regulatory subunit 6a, putative [Eimeria acervulina]|uniref:26S protease regulatory subunit 6a, putative n=1 Tax=Eimeria acervulina TaxID=5801 RepID=U6GTM0_EIMAC|nr:26S protease regulatory subunit 6a, putative [Eimeria acervulina]CDI81944.1 26S protease regulatory subunit 6a, putative [Eimeria acervulina]